MDSKPLHYMKHPEQKEGARMRCQLSGSIEIAKTGSLEEGEEKW